MGDDNSMLKKNVKFRKQIADKIGVGFELPDSIPASAVPDVPKNDGCTAGAGCSVSVCNVRN
jgi:hypothetical protein